MRSIHFKDANGDVIVKVSEKPSHAYGMYIWPCSVVLAQYVWYNRSHLIMGKKVLELGAGTALPGIIAAKCGTASCVTLTDDSCQPKCLQNICEMCDVNSITVERKGEEPFAKHTGKYYGTTVNVSGLSWGELPPIFEDNSANGFCYPDIIFAADCFFDESIYEKLLFTVRQLLERHDNLKDRPTGPSRFLCTYQVRSTKTSLESLLKLWGLQCREVPLSDFGADVHDIAGSGMPGNHKIKMLDIKISDH